MKVFFERLFFGYAASDMELLKMKIRGGILPEEARLTKYEQKALCDIDILAVLSLPCR